MSKKNDKKIRKFVEDCELIYRLLNWKWDKPRTPNVNEIEQTVRDLIREVEKSKTEEITTGGLFARRENGSISFGLKLENYL